MDDMIAFVIGGGSYWRRTGTPPQTGILSWRYTGQALPGGAVPVAALISGQFVCLHLPEGAYLADFGREFRTEPALTAGFLHYYMDGRRSGQFTNMADTPTEGAMPDAIYWTDCRWYAVAGSSARGRSTPRRAVARWRAEQVATAPRGA